MSAARGVGRSPPPVQLHPHHLCLTALSSRNTIASHTVNHYPKHFGIVPSLHVRPPLARNTPPPEAHFQFSPKRSTSQALFAYPTHHGMVAYIMALGGSTPLQPASRALKGYWGTSLQVGKNTVPIAFDPYIFGDPLTPLTRSSPTALNNHQPSLRATIQQILCKHAKEISPTNMCTKSTTSLDLTPPFFAILKVLLAGLLEHNLIHPFTPHRSRRIKMRKTWMILALTILLAAVIRNLQCISIGAKL